MPLYDYQCSQGHAHEVYARIHENILPCRTCEKPACRVLLPPRRSQNAQPFDPVVVFQEQDGSYRFPGNSSDVVPASCRKIELRSTAEVRKFESKMNSLERQEYQQRREACSRAENQYWDARRQQSRQSLRKDMENMSPQGRMFAEFAMRQRDRQLAQRSDSVEAAKFDPHFRVDVFTSDRSNRPAERKK